MANRESAGYTHLWRALGNFSDNPRGIHWTGIIFGLGAIGSFNYSLDPRREMPSLRIRK